MNALHLALLHNDAARRNQLAPTIGSTEMLGHPRGDDIAIERLCQATDHLGSLTWRQDIRRARSEHKVAVEVDDKGVGRSGEERAAFGGDTEDVGARLVDEFFGVASMNHWHIKSTPFIHTHTESNSLGSDGQNCGVMTNENDPTGWGDSRFDYANDVGDGQAGKQRPHGEVLEAGWRGWKLVAKSVVLHVDSDQVIQPGSWEAEDARHLLCMEQVCSFVPMDPHAAEVIAEEVVERISREKAQTVRNPVGFVGRIIVIRLRPSPQLADRLSSLLVSA